MIIFDLKCTQGHVFEAWFGSSADYDAQKDRGLLSCPFCGDQSVDKAVMAPAVPAKSNQRGDETSSTPHMSAAAGLDPEKARQMLAAIAAAQADAIKDSQWVGRKFASIARAIHYGEEDARGIYGEVAPQEAQSLLEEGIEVAPLLIPVVPPEAKN